MSRANFIGSAFAILLLASVSAAAEKSAPADATPKPEAVVYDAASAFKFLTSMTGDWERSGGAHDHGDDAHSVSFRPTAAGSAVMETMFAGEPMEMISMYHMDGDTLLMTHYCALQNAPVLQFVKSDKPGELKFAFKGGTNFDPKVDAHLHESTFQIIDKDTIEQRSTGCGVGSTGRLLAVDARHHKRHGR